MSHASRKLHVANPAVSPIPEARSPEATLVSPAIDRLAIGGASILLLVLVGITLKPEAPAASISWLIFSFSYAVNFPHFLVSYQMLYTDFGHKIFKETRYFWAAVVVPVVLLGVLLGSFAFSSPETLGYLAASMYFFVGWHYVKQIFGGVVVTNALNKFFYNQMERTVLKTNLFSLWAISFLLPNVGKHTYAQDGISYTSMDLPEWTVQSAYVVLGLSFAAVLYTNIQKYVRDGRTPCLSSVICFFALYAWYLPALSHPMFASLIPFFHSLQYLLFVYTFRRNKIEARLENNNTPEGRKRRVLGLYGYLAIPVITGATFMFILPRFLDGFHLINPQLFGPTAFYFSFLIFINIHHYFIDNVMWRGDNADMKEFLFRTAARR